MTPPRTLRDLVRDAAQQLEQVGIPSAEAALDAELLARDVLGWDRATWIARQHEPAPSPFAAPFAYTVGRRRTREPMAYIRGRQEFYGRDFEVSPAVLIPRPETELLVEEARLLLPALGFSRDLTVLDIGTGSGCVVVSLALEYPKATYVATDISTDALAVARANAARFGVGGRIEFRAGTLSAGARGPFNVIVTNPPYVAERERATLQPEVLRFEPNAALFAGDDGLSSIRAIVRLAGESLDEDGTLMVEIGAGQLEQVAAIADETAQLALVRARRDLAGIPRVAVIRRCR
jgi:release factor glutamine methyltransferase